LAKENKMATKKKSKIIESADIAEMINVPSGGWPMMNQGSHLTVKTFKDGRTELIWNDEALTREVKDAILSVEQKENNDGNSKIGKQSKRQIGKSK
jgi:hypothetical protein